MGRLHRVEAVFSGTVQGVGFRYAAVSVSRGFAVGGYVRNQPDGRVHLVAEGDAKEVEGFVRTVNERMAHCIRECTTSTGPASGGFVGFSVRR